MSTKALSLTVAVLLFSAYQLQADVINSLWVGGDDGLWDDASNWSPAIVPDNSEWRTFAVTISGEVGVHLGQSRTIDRLNCYGNVEFGRMNRWISLTLQDPNGLINQGYLWIELQDIDIHHGNLDNFEGSTIDLACYSSVSATTVENAGLILIPPTSSLLVDQKLHNKGQIIVYGGICGSSNGILENESTGIINGFGTLVVPGTIYNNKGKIYATGGGLTVATYDFLSNTGTIGNSTLTSLNVMQKEVVMDIGVPSDMHNFCTIEVNAGGGVAFDCNVVNEPNGVVKLLGGILAATTFTQKAGATFEGFGGITGNLVIDPNAIIKLSGPTNIVGDLAIEESAMLDISNGTVLVTGDLTCDNGIIQTMNSNIIILGEMNGVCRRDFIDVVGLTTDDHNE